MYKRQVFSRYSGHVTGVIAGVSEYNKKPEQGGYIYQIFSRSSQIEAMEWLHKNVFTNQKWLIPNNIIKNIYPTGQTETILKLQNRQLFSLLNSSKLQRMMNAEVTEKEFYAATDMIVDLRKGIFSETDNSRNVGIFRRNLQKSFIERMRVIMNTEEIKNSDLFSIVRGELVVLKNKMTIIINRNLNKITKYHYKDCIVRINDILNPKK